MNKSKSRYAAVVFILSLFSVSALAAPKYGPAGQPHAQTLFESHGYFQTKANAAPDFWALMPYYVPQMDSHACSVACLVTTVNAARAGLAKTSDDKLILQQEMMDKVNVENWKSRLSKDGYNGEHGTDLDTFGKIALVAFHTYGFPNATIETVHVADSSSATIKKVSADLAANEKSASDFIMANFDQKYFTDDTEAGHISPVAAYDSANKRVLIVDTDREWYEPYWVSVKRFVEGMATKDSGVGKNRGYIHIRLGAAAH